MFETGQFRSQLTQAILIATRQQGIARYEDSVVLFLQTLAESNETILLEAERRKPAESQRGVSHALASARNLIEVAANFAKADGRTKLTLADVNAAYIARFCQIWPFCR